MSTTTIEQDRIRAFRDGFHEDIKRLTAAAEIVGDKCSIAILHALHLLFHLPDSEEGASPDAFGTMAVHMTAVGHALIQAMAAEDAEFADKWNAVQEHLSDDSPMMQPKQTSDPAHN